MDSLTLKEAPKIFEKIHNHKTITIFRHESPDGDAYGSSVGLYAFLKQQYPDKKILMGSTQIGSLDHFFEDCEIASEDDIEKSLAIVCDTANSARIDGNALIAQEVIKIDHHPARDNYGVINCVYTDISSCSQIVAQLLLSQVGSLSETVAKYLYAGMLTDTISFSISTVNSKTLLVASKLVATGLDVAKIHDQLFQVSDNIYDYVTWLRSNATENKNGLIYCYIEQDIMDRYDLTVNRAKEVVNTFKEKKAARIWLLLLKEKSGLYRTTMRSRNIIINDIASDFGGGGHMYAAATRDLSYEQTKELLEALNDRLSSPL